MEVILRVPRNEGLTRLLLPTRLLVRKGKVMRTLESLSRGGEDVGSTSCTSKAASKDYIQKIEGEEV